MAMRGTITAYLMGPLTIKEIRFLILEICTRSQGILWYSDLSLAFDSHLTTPPYITVISVLSSCYCEPVRDFLAETVLLIALFSVPHTVPGHKRRSVSDKSPGIGFGFISPIFQLQVQ